MLNDTVLCVMLTGGSPRRHQLALRALQSWRRQDWQRRLLVVVNESQGTPWERSLIEQPWPSEHELLTPHRRLTTGARRNLALEAVPVERAGWVIGWDDDDWSASWRLRWLMERRVDDERCVAVTSHVRYSLPRRTGYVYSCDVGCGGIALYPRGDWRWPDLDKGEDSELFLGFHARDSVALYNNQTTAHDYIRLAHGDNLNDERHIMRQFAARRWNGRWPPPNHKCGLSPTGMAHVLNVIEEQYGWWPGDDA